MSRISVDVPDVTIKTGKMLSHWSPKSKAGALLLALALYVYILIFLKTIYLKSQRLDHIDFMAMETEKMIQNVHNIDQDMALHIQQLDNLSDV